MFTVEPSTCADAHASAVRVISVMSGHFTGTGRRKGTNGGATHPAISGMQGWQMLVNNASDCSGEPAGDPS